jgi:hypothetical protein
MQRRLGRLFTALFIEENIKKVLKHWSGIRDFSILSIYSLQYTADQRNNIQNENKNVQVTKTTEKANRTNLCKLSCRTGLSQGLGSGSVLGGKLLAMSAPLQTSGKLMPSTSRENCKKAAD